MISVENLQLMGLMYSLYNCIILKNKFSLTQKKTN
jgi:hypothetical protein